MWKRHEVATAGHGRKEIRHPDAGTLLFEHAVFHPTDAPDQRLILFQAPHRRRPLTADEMLIAKRHSSFSLEKTRRYLPLMQVRIRDSADREIALEFRPRDRKVGREVATVLSGQPRRQSDVAEW